MELLVSFCYLKGHVIFIRIFVLADCPVLIVSSHNNVYIYSLEVRCITCVHIYGIDIRYVTDENQQSTKIREE